MYCKTCGKEINENAVVCVNCGVLLDNATLEQINGQKESKKTNVCALVGFILSLVGFVLGIYVSPLIVAGFILSIIGLTQYKKTGVGKGFAIAGGYSLSHRNNSKGNFIDLALYCGFDMIQLR